MNKLMKYEMRKTMSAKLILLGITAVLEILFLVGLYTEKHDLMGTGAVLLAILAIGGILVIGLQSVVTLHRDMNTRQGYMLFMTPNSCYRILGAKVLENGLSILLGGVFFFALGALDITLLFSKEGNLQDLWEMIEKLLQSLDQTLQFNLESLACFAFLMLAAWIATVTAAYLADVVSAALLNGKKMNGLISFVIFLALSFLASVLTKWVLHLMMPDSAIRENINLYHFLRGVVSLILSGVMYVATAQIMEKKLSV